MEAYAKREAFYRDVVEPAEGRYEEIAPNPPSEMLALPGDYELLGLQGTAPSPVWVRTPDGSGRWAPSFADASVELMRNTPRTQQDWDNMVSIVRDGKAIRVHGTKPHPKAQARANEIVAAYDTLMASRRERMTHSGLTEADGAYTVLTANIEALVAELVEYPATTFRGLIMKANCAELDGLKVGGFDWLFTQEVEADGGISTRRLERLQSLGIWRGSQTRGCCHERPSVSVFIPLRGVPASL
jgi:hypothetical protein